MKRIYGTAVLAALFALAAPAQDPATAIKQMQDDLAAAVGKLTLINVESSVTSNVKNAPYQADQITENTQTLGDGTRIHNERKVTIYRDSQGRTRREQGEEISIMDPNSGAGYILNTKTMTARKTHVSVSANSGNPDGVLALKTGFAFTADGGAGGENVPLVFTSSRIVTDRTETSSVTVNGQTVTVSPNKESLGTQMMEGVNAQGDRRTRTIETGSIGNDRPIQIVSERWYSPDLQVEVMTRRNDPRTGEEVTRLVNIIRAEPDSSLFQVPASYQIVEGPGGRGGRGGRGGGQ
jgi:hypothetical protein